MKKIISLILSLTMLLSVTAGLSVTAYAASVRTVSGLTVESKTTTSVKLKWKKVKKATGYQVYYSTSKNKNYKKAKSIAKGKTVTAKITKLKPNKKYYFKVRAVKGKNKGKFSSIVSVKTKKWGEIKKLKITSGSVVELDDEGEYLSGAYYLFFDFDKVSDALGYQVKYYWDGEKANYTTIKNNRFYFCAQDNPPIIKIRAYKKNKKGNKVYGDWKTVKIDFNKTKKGHDFYYDEFKEYIEKNQYESIW